MRGCASRLPNTIRPLGKPRNPLAETPLFHTPLLWHHDALPSMSDQSRCSFVNTPPSTDSTPSHRLSPSTPLSTPHSLIASLSVLVPMLRPAPPPHAPRVHVERVQLDHRPARHPRHPQQRPSLRLSRSRRKTVCARLQNGTYVSPYRSVKLILCFGWAIRRARRAAALKKRR